MNIKNAVYDRNVGIEVLRVVSMFMVVFLHVLNHGIDYPKLKLFSINWFFGWFIEALCYCAVNIYAMISGYVMVNSKTRVARLIILWFTISFTPTSFGNKIFNIISLITE